MTPDERFRTAQALHRLARALGVELLPEVPLHASLERLAAEAELQTFWRHGEFVSRCPSYCDGRHRIADGICKGCGHEAHT